MYVIAYVRASVFVCVCVLMRAYVQSCVLLSENSNAKDGHRLTLIVSNLKKNWRCSKGGKKLLVIKTKIPHKV